MKKLIFCMMALLAVVACSKSDDVDNGGTTGGTQSKEIELSSTSLHLSAEETSGSILFTSTVAWSAEVTEGQEWCTIDPGSGNAGSARISVATAINDDIISRTAKVVVKAGKSEETVQVIQRAVSAHKKERDALIAFYNATGGDNWTNNENWCTESPVEDWYGITVDEDGLVYSIFMWNNNLVGEIPDDIKYLQQMRSLTLAFSDFTKIPNAIGEMPNMRELALQGCRFTVFPEDVSIFRYLTSLDLTGHRFNCELPETIGTLTNLEYLHLRGNTTCERIDDAFNGRIPASIGNLTKLKELTLSDNNFVGEIPASFGNLTNLEFLSLGNNVLSGNVPQSIMDLDCWPYCWQDIIRQYDDNGGISKEGLMIPAPKFTEKTVDGGVIDDSVFATNEYTILYHYYDRCVNSNGFTPSLMQMYDGYKDKGLGVIAFSDEGEDYSYRAYAEKFNTTWPYIFLTRHSRGFVLYFRSYVGGAPYVDVVDKNGNVVFNHVLDNYNDLDEFLLEKLGEPNNMNDDQSYFYTSADYSKNGEVKILQTATVGNGIDIVLMGDAYSDRLIADGTYDKAMNTAMEKFFEVEPYKSFRDHFNVYSVTAVSANELYAESTSTVFKGYFGEGTHVGGDDQVAFTYAQKAISADRINDALIVVMMNSNTHAGTCYMYGPSEGDWGDGASVSYFPVGADAVALARVLHHEAGGHGFSKLGDEYAYESQGAIPGSEISDAQNLSTYGWWKNVDFTNDPTQVKWYHFLTDSRYSNEGLGIYEGAFTYWTGAYRPTENSIMNTNVGGFNAPSREAIYYRIHKLAYGADWEYDYEEFVEWDAKNRSTSSSTRGIPYRPTATADFKPTHPPVVINKTWREAMNQ